MNKEYNFRKLDYIESLDDITKKSIVLASNHIDPESNYVYDKKSTLKKGERTFDSMEFYYSPDKENVYQVQAIKEYIDVINKKLLLNPGYFVKNEITKDHQDFERMYNDLKLMDLIN